MTRVRVIRKTIVMVKVVLHRSNKLIERMIESQWKEWIYSVYQREIMQCFRAFSKHAIILYERKIAELEQYIS